MLRFLETFPTEFKTYLTQEGIDVEIAERMMTGHQMLEVVQIGGLCFFPELDIFFGEPAACVGYPTADGSLGSYFNLHGNKLAISSTCRNKEVAWDFIRDSLARRYSDAVLLKEHTHSVNIKIPVLYKNYEKAKQFDLKDKSRKGILSGPLDKLYFRVGECTPDQARRFETLVQNTTQIYWPNDDLSDIVWETIQPYFAGDRTLDDTLRLLDNRVTVYVNENR